MISEGEYKKVVCDTINLTVFNMKDSVFDEKYNLSETDIFYLIYRLTATGKCLKNDIMKLMQLEDITFTSIYEICN